LFENILHYRPLFLPFSCINNLFPLNLCYIRDKLFSPSWDYRGVSCVSRLAKDLSFSPPPGFLSTRARAIESNLPINSYLSCPLYALWTTGDTVGSCNWILVFTFKSILAALCSHPHVPLSVYASSPIIPPSSTAILESPETLLPRSLSQYNVTRRETYYIALQSATRMKTSRRNEIIQPPLTSSPIWMPNWWKPVSRLYWKRGKPKVCRKMVVMINQRRVCVKYIQIDASQIYIDARWNYYPYTNAYNNARSDGKFPFALASSLCGPHYEQRGLYRYTRTKCFNDGDTTRVIANSCSCVSNFVDNRHIIYPDSLMWHQFNFFQIQICKNCWFNFLYFNINFLKFFR